jgi:hypothetical protein
MFSRIRADENRAQRGRAPDDVTQQIFLPSALVLAALIADTGARGAELAFKLRIENGRVPDDMRVVRVKQGDVVTLRWSVDQSMILHLHGYDIERRVEPGAVGEMSFTAGATGRFPVHAHPVGPHPGSRAHEEAPLVYVEVYPR